MQKWYSEKIKNQIAEWLDGLETYVNKDGKCLLSSIRKDFKREFGHEIDFISEKLFDEKHQTLYDLLEGQAVRITKSEMRLCALLNLNYALPEIAKLTRKRPNSIHVAFARIRTKLGFTRNDELRDFLKILTNEGASSSEHSEKSKGE